MRGEDSLYRHAFRNILTCLHYKHGEGNWKLNHSLNISKEEDLLMCSNLILIFRNTSICSETYNEICFELRNKSHYVLNISKIENHTWHYSQDLGNCVYCLFRFPFCHTYVIVKVNYNTVRVPDYTNNNDTGSWRYLADVVGWVLVNLSWIRWGTL